jgi:hypothetical protein
VPNNKAPVAQWIERLFPKQKVIGSTPIWRVLLFSSELFFFFFCCSSSHEIKQLGRENCDSNEEEEVEEAMHTLSPKG